MCVSVWNPLCPACGHPFLTRASDVVTLSWSSSISFHISLGGHTQVWLEPRIFASVLSPKLFLWRLQTVLPNSFPDPSCLSCQISLHSPPQPFGLIHVILVLSLLLGKETDVQMSVTEQLLFSAACLLSISVSLFPFSFQPCLSWTPGQWKRWVAAPRLVPSPVTTHLPASSSTNLFLLLLHSVQSLKQWSLVSRLLSAVPMQGIYSK